MSKIAVMDSGLGGYILLQHLIKKYPEQDFVLFADQKNNPYGNKTTIELIEILKKNINWLKQNGVTSIVLACNTACSTNIDKMIDDIEIETIILPTIMQIDPSKHHNVLVLATKHTIETDIYKNMINENFSNVNVYQHALSQLVSDIENLIDTEIISVKLKQILNDYIGKVDCVILGCTHFPYIQNIFEEMFGCEILNSNNIKLNNFNEGNGIIDYITTGDDKILDKQVKTLFNQDIKSKRIVIKIS